MRFSESMLEGGVSSSHAALDFHLRRPADHDGATLPLRSVVLLLPTGRSYTAIRTRPIRPDVTAVDVHWQMTGATDAQGNPRPDRRGLLSFPMEKNAGQWQIGVMHNLDLTACRERDDHPAQSRDRGIHQRHPHLPQAHDDAKYDYIGLVGRARKSRPRPNSTFPRCHNSHSMAPNPLCFTSCMILTVDFIAISVFASRHRYKSNRCSPIDEGV